MISPQRSHLQINDAFVSPSYEQQEASPARVDPGSAGGSPRRRSQSDWPVTNKLLRSLKAVSSCVVRVYMPG